MMRAPLCESVSQSLWDRLMKLSVILKQRCAEIVGSRLPWCLRDFEAVYFFLVYDIQSPKDLKEFIQTERPPDTVDYHAAYHFCRICNLLVYHLQLVKCFSREEEASYLKVVYDHYHHQVWLRWKKSSS